MKLGIALNYSQTQLEIPIDYVRKAEELGYDSVWTAEAYGSDALTPLAYLASITSRIRLGTGIVQLSARTAASLAMTAATLDQLANLNSEGKASKTDGANKSRVIIGIGVSGPQIVEGWYGQPWGKPAKRLEDYITIIRKILKREEHVSHKGTEIQLPYTGSGALGQGKPLKSILHTNPDIPIWIGCGGKISTQLMAEIADGWLPMGLTPENWEQHKPIIKKGLDKSNRTLKDLEIQGGCTVDITDDLENAWAKRKPSFGLLIGGYGSKTHNFHKEAMIKRGYGEAAEKIQELFIADKREEAYNAVPDSYIDEMGLFGPVERIKERFERYRGIYTGITINPVKPYDIETLELMKDLADGDETTKAKI